MKKIMRFTAALLLCALLAGCGVDSDTKVVLTTGFTKDEIFKINDIVCTKPEMMVYLTNIQNKYEKVYTDRIWNTQIDGMSMEESVKENALSKMAQIKTIVLLAGERGIELDERELELVNEATDKYYSSLNSVEISSMGIDRETIYNLYSEYALSQKTYNDMIKDVNPEISDDEARTITVQDIEFKIFGYDDDGEKVTYNDSKKQEVRRQAELIAERANQGEDFEKLAVESGIEGNITISFGKGEMDPVLENEAFNLGSGEISKVIETEYGYHVLKCISTFNKEVTDENKKKIVDKRKQEAFNEEYEIFVQSLIKSLNEDLWGQTGFIHDENVTTDDFFEVFEEVINE